tara:strand:- start:470 stop:979 length:510 start_codon:yes stop_codon:yes gene_type:complete
MWGKQKFIFFYLSTGFGAAGLQLLLYYYQVGQVSDALTDFGMNAVQINKFYQTAYLPTAAIDQIGESTLSGGFNAYRSVMVGASGALYGVLVGFAMIFPNARLMLLFPPIPVKAKVLVPILILSDLFFGFSSYSIGPIAHFAHVGGAITGLIMMRIWKKNDSNANRWDL